MEKQRLDKIEATQQIMLDRLDELTLAITKAINQEQEITVSKFRGNQSKSYESQGRFAYPSFGTGANQGAIS